MIAKYKVWLPSINRMYNVACIDMDGIIIRRGVPSLIVDDALGSCFELDECVLVQFTGLKDKNGVEIYEGDILYDSRCEADSWYAKSYKVVFVDCTARFAMQAIDTERYGEAEWTIDSMEVEVIGNIHETPELSKE